MEKEYIISIVFSNRTIDSLERILNRFLAEENRLGAIISQRELSKLYRDNANFEEAIKVGIEGLKPPLK